ncbi:MAG: DUF2889 domain-containing protein [Alphaproteobacteria bacterium]|nr:MAG: DUF2889 domain-containing protein [Alphaproteobacteria bacterium]
MALSAPVARRRIHHRRIDVEGFLRDDGLWDIEARIVDVKDYAFENTWRGTVQPGTPIHDMRLRLTIDTAYLVIAVEATTDASPFEVCPAITSNFQRLVGLAIGKGWRKAIQQRLGGVEGCTHLVELLGPLGTVAFQTIAPYRERLPKPDQPATTAARPPRRPAIIDTCHALAADGEVVRRHFPAFYTGPERGPGQEGA